MQTYTQMAFLRPKWCFLGQFICFPNNYPKSTQNRNMEAFYDIRRSKDISRVLQPMQDTQRRNKTKID